MRILMGVIKDRHGTFYARKKVPKALEVAVAEVIANGKRRQPWLKKSLGTKSGHEANIRCRPVLMEFGLWPTRRDIWGLATAMVYWATVMEAMENRRSHRRLVALCASRNRSRHAKRPKEFRAASPDSRDAVQ
jgi:hypothetical protein